MVQRNIIFPNVWLVRREIFFSAHPNKKIFPSTQGQNWQLILPLAYRYKYGYINEPLCIYVTRSQSHSHTPRNLQQSVERNLGFIELLTATLKQLNAPNEKELLDFVFTKFMHQNLMLGINHGDANLIYDCCKKAEENHLDIFGTDVFDLKLLLNRYIFPRINLQVRLDEIKSDISKLNDKLQK